MGRQKAVGSVNPANTQDVPIHDWIDRRVRANIELTERSGWQRLEAGKAV
jgi:hypothetical protein